MKFAFNACAAAVALACSAIAMATTSGGFSTATGGSTATQITISNYADLVTELAALQKAESTTPTVIYYTGNEDSLIAAAKTNVCGQYSKTSRTIPLKRVSNVTIIGATGSSANFGLNLVDDSNIIIRNMTFAMMPGGEESDGITIDSSTNVWIDHNTLYTRNYNCPDAPGDGHDSTFDGLIDVKKTADNVTISYNYIHDHHKVSLDGYTTNDVARNVTYHHNYYDNVNARLPLQRNGLIHIYNNYYNRVGYEDMNLDPANPGNIANGGTGINVRQAGKALIQNSYFENAVNPVTCRFDSSNCGTWQLLNNNITSAADFTKYNITWTDGGTGSVDATAWTSTATITQPAYMSTVEPVNAQCVKDQLINYAGAGKGLAELVASKCSGSSTSSSSSSAASSSSSSKSSSSSSAASSSSSSKSSSSSSSTASSSSSSKSSSSSSSSASSAPALTGTGDYPDGFSKCADLGGTCAVPSGTGWVAFGRKGNWVTAYVGVGKSIACTVAAFGSDPVGNPNKCSYQK
jgi:pectate lyase